MVSSHKHGMICKIIILTIAITTSFYAHIHITGLVLLEELGSTLDDLATANTELQIIVSNIEVIDESIEILQREQQKVEEKVNANKEFMDSTTETTNRLNVITIKDRVRLESLNDNLTDSAMKANGCRQHLQSVGAAIGKPTNLLSTVTLYVRYVTKCKSHLKKSYHRNM